MSATEIQVLCENPKGLAFMVTGPIDPTLDSKGRFKAKPGQEVYTFGVMTMCPGTEQEQAGTGKTIAVVTFEGQASRSQKEASVTWVVAPQSHYLARTDDKSWMTDAGGKQYKKPFFLATKEKRELAVVVPADASGLVWHDGKKKAYQLEPTVVELLEAAPARATPPGKTQ